MIREGIQVKNSEILILGITFKENCPDIRNIKVINVIDQLKEFGTNISVYDPWASPEEVKKEYQTELIETLEDKKFDSIVLAVQHEIFRSLSLNNYKKEKCIIYDFKNFLS